MNATSELTASTEAIRTASRDEPIKFVTFDEAREYDKLMNKTFVHKAVNGKPHETTKDYFYMILSISPSQPVSKNPISPSQFTMDFQVQKYHRKKTYTAKETLPNGTTKDVQKPVAVKRWAYDEDTAEITGGGLEVVDEDASFGIDSRKFLAEFQQE